MSPEYRTPDPWALQHRTEIQVIALGLGIVGALALFKAEYPVNLAGCLIAFTAIIGYGWIHQKWTPEPGDFIEYLEAIAEDEEQLKWVLQVEQDFHQLWELGPRTTLKEVFSE